MDFSAGFLIRSGDKFLICHTTRQKHEHGWTIPKGKLEQGEDAFDAALREVQEESNLDLDSIAGLRIHKYPYAIYRMKHKQVTVFLAIDESGALVESSKDILKCNTFVDNNKSFPEVDNFMWATAEEAQPLVTHSQKFLFEGEYK